MSQQKSTLSGLIAPITVILIVSTCFGQTYWNRIYSEGNNYYYYPGIFFESENHNILFFREPLLMEITPDGDTLWTRKSPFAPIIPSGDGNFYGGKSITDNVLIYKFNYAGDIIWSKSYKQSETISTMMSEVRPSVSIPNQIVKIFPTNEGNYLIYCTANETYESLNYLFLRFILINPTGDLLCERTYKVEKGFAGIKPTPKGDFLLWNGTVTKGCHFFKINNRGDSLWSKSFFQEPDSLFQEISSIAISSDDNTLITGVNIWGKAFASHWLFNMRPDGEVSWYKKSDILPFESSFSMAYRTLNDNYFLISPRLQSILKMNKYGRSLWTKRIENETLKNSNFWKLVDTKDNNHLLIMNGENPGVIKINTEGDILWTRRLGADYKPEINTAFMTSDGDYILGGDVYSFTNNFRSFWVGRLIDDRYAKRDSLFCYKIPIYGSDSLDYHFTPVKMPPEMTISSGGTFSWIPKTDSTYMEHIECLVTDISGRTDTLSYNIFINYNRNYSGITKRFERQNKTKTESVSIIVSDNGLKFLLPVQTSSVQIFDTSGKMVKKIKPYLFKNESAAIRLQNLPAGKYFARIISGNSSCVKSFLFTP